MSNYYFLIFQFKLKNIKYLLMWWYRRVTLLCRNSYKNWFNMLNRWIMSLEYKITLIWPHSKKWLYVLCCNNNDFLINILVSLSLNKKNLVYECLLNLLNNLLTFIIHLMQTLYDPLALIFIKHTLKRKNEKPKIISFYNWLQFVRWPKH